MKQYGCHSDKQGDWPRGKAGKYLMQDGWKLTQGPGFISREPVMKIVVTPWKPIKCGILQQTGKGKDPLCAGCKNEPRD